ncbi:metal-dependent hydrolase [Aeromicrobium sp.]|nr:metal-dependent hydrolase [Candidatus Saccharibacteria bacterium]
MLARTHDLAAITALALVAATQAVPQMTLSTLIAVLLANQIGGIAPDIDQPTAPFWRNLPVGHVLGRFAGKLLGGHRFLSHSLLGVALFAFLTKLFLEFFQPLFPHVDSQLVWYAFIIGILSHLVMDTITKEGVPWLLPIPIKFGVPPLRSLRITTGSWREVWLVLPLLLVIDLWLLNMHYTSILSYLHHLQR